MTQSKTQRWKAAFKKVDSSAAKLREGLEEIQQLLDEFLAWGERDEGAAIDSGSPEAQALAYVAEADTHAMLDRLEELEDYIVGELEPIEFPKGFGEE